MKSNLMWFLNGVLIAIVVAFSIGATSSGVERFKYVDKQNGYVVLDKENGHSYIVYRNEKSSSYSKQSFNFR